ncbi:MAG: antitoxin [Candidatus Parabeggiatoa sp. nov. 2]|nr:MAG: antitoxin [Beggiatoa sp. 4572_84]
MDLDQEELDMLESFERGEWQSVSDKEPEIKRHQAYAKATFEQDKHLDVYLSVRDFNVLQKRALIEGIPYQTLVSSILHKYVSGYLLDRSSDNLVTL